MKMLEIKKIYNEDCIIGLKKLDSEQAHHMMI